MPSAVATGYWPRLPSTISPSIWALSVWSDCDDCVPDVLLKRGISLACRAMIRPLRSLASCRHPAGARQWAAPGDKKPAGHSPAGHAPRQIAPEETRSHRGAHPVTEREKKAAMLAMIQ